MNNDFMKKIEAYLMKLAWLQLLFLIVAQVLLYHKGLSPYLSKTIFSEGIFLEFAGKTMETLDRFMTLWYDI